MLVDLGGGGGWAILTVVVVLGGFGGWPVYWSSIPWSVWPVVCWYVCLPVSRSLRLAGCRLSVCPLCYLSGCLCLSVCLSLSARLSAWRLFVWLFVCRLLVFQFWFGAPPRPSRTVPHIQNSTSRFYMYRTSGSVGSICIEPSGFPDKHAPHVLDRSASLCICTGRLGIATQTAGSLHDICLSGRSCWAGRGGKTYGNGRPRGGARSRWSSALLRGAGGDKRQPLKQTPTRSKFRTTQQPSRTQALHPP